jgi:hypothetical protein
VISLIIFVGISPPVLRGRSPGGSEFSREVKKVWPRLIVVIMFSILIYVVFCVYFFLMICIRTLKMRYIKFK